MSALRYTLLAVDWIPWVIGLPLAYAVAAFLCGARAASVLAVPALALSLLAAAGLSARVLAQGPLPHAVGGWGAPLGIELYADGLSCVMLLMTAAITLLIAWYARHYFARGGAGATYFWPLAGFLLGAMNALYLAADVFNLYVTLELLGLAAVGLAALTGGATALAAALRYLLAALAGSLFYLLGVALAYGAHGTLALGELGALLVPGPLAWTVIALMTLGLALKTALFPLHFWLPPAHGGAATPVSALLSALVIKASFYLLLRLWFEMFAPAVTVSAAQLLGVLGSGAILWGSWLALHQRKVKMIVAYSTVAQIGYLFLLFPLAAYAPGVESAWNGGVYHAASHAFAKAAMFLAVGSMVLAAGRDDLDQLDGISAQLPLSLFSLALAGISLMGLPPSGGFIAKWLLLKAALATGQWWWAAVLILGGLLTAAYLFRVLRHAFLPARRRTPFRALPPALELSAFVLALGSLALGLWAAGPLALLRAGAPFTGLAP
jgi:formate hydrogenlyase subunit 3/multisubunit Na+/H+ antiporter MnhD subunit